MKTNLYRYTISLIILLIAHFADAQNASIIVGGATYINMSSGSNLVIPGDFTNNGNGISATSAGTVLFNGTATQNINGINPTAFNNVIKSTIGSVIMLTQDETISNNLSLIGSSFLDLKGHVLTLNGAFSGAGSLIGSPLSGLILGGAASTLSFDQTGTNNYLKTLTLTSTSTATLGNPLYITASDGSNINTYGIVTANGTLTTNGNLTLKSDLRGDAIVGVSSGTINGSTTVERYVYARRAWRFLTAPFSPNSAYNSITQTIKQAWQENRQITTAPTTCPVTDDPLAPNGYGMFITNNYDYANGYDWNTTSSPSLKVWSGTAWIAPLNTTSTSITAYPAYYTFVRGDRHICLQYGTYATPFATTLRAQGQLNELAAATVSPFLGTYNSGDFVAIGNPYASPVNFRTGITYSELDVNNVYVLDPAVGGTYGAGGYIVYSTQLPLPNQWLVVGGGGYGNYSMGSPPVVQSGQAFLMKATGANPVIPAVQFTQSAKVTTEFNTSGLIANTGNNNSTESSFAAGKSGYDRTVLYTELLLTDDSLNGADKVAVIFGNKYKSDDSVFSAKKFWSPYNNLSIWKNGFYAISCRPVPGLTDTVFFKSYLTTGTNYTLRLFAQNVMANIPARGWLVDKYLNNKTEINLHDTTMFSFTATSDTNSYRNRFMIVFNRQLSTTPVPVTKVANQQNPNISGNAATINTSESGVNIYPNPVADGIARLKFVNMDKGNYAIKIYNASGQLLAEKDLMHNGGISIHPVTLNATWPNGVYSVNVINKSTQKTSNLKLILGK